MGYAHAVGDLSSESSVLAVERPHRSLLTYYVLGSFVLGPLFFIPLIPRYFRYHTLRYRFDDEGVSARWGILFRKEIHLTYARIQDIHLRSNFVERWLKLARVEIQTASGSAKAELTVEGLLEYEAVRDFLYSRMRGIKTADASADRSSGPAWPESAGVADGDLALTLREVARELRGIRTALEARSGRGAPDA